MLAARRMLGSYKTLATLGDGGMGEVYRARFEREAPTIPALEHAARRCLAKGPGSAGRARVV